MTTVVFLHVPKTAGQTIHNALVSAVGGPEHVSPIRTHTQAGQGPQMPVGYSLYSGHIDWLELEALPQDRFVFSVLRDPRERIASFYLYLMKEAQALSEENLALRENTGKRQLLQETADEYFFGGTPHWQNFVRDHYNNFYCSYFATRKMRGGAVIKGMSAQDLLMQAQVGLTHLDAVYSTENLAPLETDIVKRLGTKISVTNTFQNAGEQARGELRWPKLLSMLERDASVAKLEQFVELDEALMETVNFR